MHDRIDAVLMASGFSRRYGCEDKLLRPFCGTPLAEHALRLCCGMGCFDSIRFVYASPEVGFLAKKYPVEAILNERPERGQCESIRLGILPSTADYYLFVPCDQPLLDAATVAAVLSKRQPGRIVEPFCGDKTGGPSLFASRFKPLLAALADNENARNIKRSHSQLVTRVEILNPLALFDVDTPDDFAYLEEYAVK